MHKICQSGSTKLFDCVELITPPFFPPKSTKHLLKPVKANVTVWLDITLTPVAPQLQSEWHRWVAIGYHPFPRYAFPNFKLNSTVGLDITLTPLSPPIAK